MAADESNLSVVFKDPVYTHTHMRKQRRWPPAIEYQGYTSRDQTIPMFTALETAGKSPRRCIYSTLRLCNYYSRIYFSCFNFKKEKTQHWAGISEISDQTAIWALPSTRNCLKRTGEPSDFFRMCYIQNKKCSKSNPNK